MLKIVYLFIGGGVGTLLRFWISGYTNKLMSSQFPTGTLTVNLIGCLIIGVLAGLNNTHSLSENTRLLLFTGLLGGFTTFSSFSNETVQLLRTGHHLWAALYVVASNAGGFLLAAGGYALFKGAPNGG